MQDVIKVGNRAINAAQVTQVVWNEQVDHATAYLADGSSIVLDGAAEVPAFLAWFCPAEKGKNKDKPKSK